MAVADCESGDIVVKDEFLPSDVRPGDLIAVPGTGAYCRSMASNYNHVPRPPVVAVSDWIRAVPDQISRWVPGPYTSLGTDGYGFSDTRPAARRFFHVDAESIALMKRRPTKDLYALTLYGRALNWSFGFGVAWGGRWIGFS